LLAAGLELDDVCQPLKDTPLAMHRWFARYSHMKASDGKRLR
jgi:hypothetical protein